MSACAAGILAAALLSTAAVAQTRERANTIKRVTLGALTAQGFEVKAFAVGEAVILQKGPDVYRCNLRVADTSPLSYQSDCYAVR
jgi:hypothetical protein